MAKGGIDTGRVLDRIDRLRRPDDSRPDGLEPVTAFCKRCNIDEASISRWRSGVNISLQSLKRIVEATKDEHPYVSIDWLVFGRTPDGAAYQLVERLASDVQEAVNRSLELIPDGKPLKLVRDDGPPPEPPGEDPSEHE